MDNDTFLKDIFQRYLNNECTAEEVKFLLKHFRSDSEEDALKEIIAEKLKDYSLDDKRQLHADRAVADKTFSKILDRINLEEAVYEGDEGPAKKRPALFKGLALLMVALVLFECAYLYYKPVGVQTDNLVRVHKKPVIVPGGNKAILTLQDGSTIVLNDAKEGTIIQQGNTRIIKLANGQIRYDGTDGPADKVSYNTMTTPRGGEYKLTLPDGTEVWLNSASSITYPTAFVTKERKVSITGEAYFEVAKDKTKPFMVTAGNQNIEVLGTHFNVMAYADEETIKTTLLEGSVKITEHNNVDILKPGEQAIVGKQGGIKVKTVNTDEAMAWKNGYFKFNRVDIKYIMRQIARWYDVDIAYEGAMPEDEFVGKIGRGENIKQVLHVLELEHVHFKIEGKKITVLP